MSSNPTQNKHVTVIIATSLLSSAMVVGMWIDTSLAVRQIGASIQGLSSLSPETVGVKCKEEREFRGNDGREITAVESIDTLEVINAIRSELQPLSLRMNDLDVRIGSLVTSYRSGSKQTGANNSMPPGTLILPDPQDFQSGGAPPFAGGEISSKSLAIFHKALNENAERVQQRIQAETDIDNPDPAVIQRIMFESQADLASELSMLLPKEDYEAVLPPVLNPKMKH